MLAILQHLALATLFAVLVPQAEPAAPKPTAAPPAPPTAAARTFTTADELLDALETADRDLRIFQAEVQYRKRFADIQGGDAQTRRGRLFFISDPPAQPGGPPRRAFAVVFDTLIVDNARRDETTKFIFDGQWLVERNESTKQFLKRRIVPEGKVVDPLRIGEGPLVLPLGQKKAEILKRFDATLLPIDDGLNDDDKGFRGALNNTVQVRLVPKPGLAEGRDFEEIRLWYRTSDLLPRAARTKTPNGAASEILLINHARNGTIDRAIFSTAPPDSADGWDIDVREDVRMEAEQPDTVPGK